MDVMLDLETLDTLPESVILTIGAVKFDPYSNKIGDGLYIKPDVDEQSANGRTINEDTLNWWMNQAEDVREEALSMHDRISVEEMYRQLNRFLVGADNVWAQGPVFDMVIMANIYRQYGWPTPWQYWQVADSRTLFKVHGDPRVKGKAGLHNALEDCISQAQAVQTIYKNLGLKSKWDK
jgi:Fe-S cluster biosynthesis and repair protein YggX